MQFDHIGIVVPDIALGKEQIANMFPIETFSDEIVDPVINVRIVFATDVSAVRYELIAPLNEKSPLTSVLKSKKNVLNHVAYKVSEFSDAVARYQQTGMMVSAPCPAVAFGGKQVAFFMMPIGIIVELIEG